MLNRIKKQASTGASSRGKNSLSMINEPQAFSASQIDISTISQKGGPSSRRHLESKPSLKRYQSSEIIQQPIIKRRKSTSINAINKIFDANGKFDFKKVIKTVIVSSEYYRKQHEVNFNFRYFFQSMLLHLLLQSMLPIMVILLRLCVNKNRLYNQGFLGCHFVTVLEYANYFANLSSILVYFIFKPDQSISFILIVISANLLRMFIVSIRYGYTVRERIKLLSAKRLSNFEIQKEFILRGWLHFDPVIIENQIQGSMTRLMIENFGFKFTFIDDIPPLVKKKLTEKFYYQSEFFQIKSHVQQLDRISNCILHENQNQLSKKFYQEPKYKIKQQDINQAKRWKIGGNKKVTLEQIKQRYSGFMTAREILLYSLKNNNWVFLVAMLSALILGIVPIVISFIEKGHVSQDPSEIMFFVFFLMSCFLIFLPNISFILVGAADLERKVFLLKCLTKMITPNLPNRFEFTKSALIPTLDICSEANYYNWLKLRKIFLDVGKKFTSRIFLYMGFYVAAIISIFAFFVLNYLKVVEIQVPLNLTVYIAFWSALIFYMLMVFLYKGAEINKFFDYHIVILKQIKMNIMASSLEDGEQFNKFQFKTPFMNKLREVLKLEGVVIQQKQEQLVQAIDNVIDSLELEGSVNKLTFLGIQMTYGLLKAFYGFVFSLAVAFLASRFGIQ